MMNYQWRVNTMVGNERDLEDDVQSNKSHRKGTSRRPKYRFSRGCRNFGRWCTKCCEHQEDSDSDSIKSDASFFKRRRRKKLRRHPEREVAQVEDVEVDEGEVSEEQGSSHVSGIPYQVSDDEEMPQKKTKNAHKKHHKEHRSSEDMMFKGSEEPDEKILEIQEDAFVDPPHHHTHHHHHRHKKHDTHHGTEHKQHNHKQMEYREITYCHRKPEKPKKHHKARKESDFEETCCYLCARNTLAIAAAAKKCDQCSQISAHSFPADKVTKETCDKSCNPITNMRTVQSSVKVKTRDRCTLCPESKKKEKGKHKSRYKKFGIFPKVKLTKCPATRTVACGTERSPRKENRMKRDQKYERCCGEREHNRF